MAIKIGFKKLRLRFKFRAGTSRGFMNVRDTWFLMVTDHNQTGIGECAPLSGLSIEPAGTFEEDLKAVIEGLGKNLADGGSTIDEIIGKLPPELPSIRFGLETALIDLANGGNRVLYDTGFEKGSKKIPINGLVWMGSPAHMMKQVDQKIEQGFSCIKIKIGALDFKQELKVLSYIRDQFGSGDLEIRVDANGAFSENHAVERLDQLGRLDIHSIEQPIKPGQTELMATLCEQNNLPIALDEELIGIHKKNEKEDLLDNIKPCYVVLKPTLLGGFDACREWIEAAESRGIGWWITSALESNIGLNAIAQFTSTFSTSMYQGLGTGSLYDNNIESPLLVDHGFLSYRREGNWDLGQLIG